jgi:hypothetical protein
MFTVYNIPSSLHPELLKTQRHEDYEQTTSYKFFMTTEPTMLNLHSWNTWKRR